MHYNWLEYLVRFKGYNESHNQWHSQLYAKSKIAQFHHKHPSAACHINMVIFNSIPFTRVDLVTSWQSSHIETPHLWRGGNVREHPSISLLPLSSPTLPLSIGIPHPHLCTIPKDHTYSR
jgi:hypothetical protein